MGTMARAQALAAVVMVAALASRLAEVFAADELAPAIGRLLEVGWSTSPKARQAADAAYEELRPVGEEDVRFLKAGWLVLCKQGRYEEALPRLEAYLARNSSDLWALRVKVWVHTLRKNYDAAAVAAEALSRALVEAKRDDEASRATYEEMVAFLGRWLGFLAGPAGGQFPQDQRRTLERRFLERLEPTWQVRLEDARDGVLSRFVLLGDEAEEARQQVVEKAQAERARTLADLQAERQRLAERTTTLEDERRKLRDELQAQLAELDRQERPLLAELAQLDQRVGTLTGNLVQLEAQITWLMQWAAQEKNPDLQQQYQAQANALALVAARVDADLAAVQRRMQEVQGRRAVLIGQRAQAQSRSSAAAARLEQEKDDVERQRRRLELLEKRASRPLPTASGRVSALTSQAAAWSTYDTLPLETLKEQLWRSLR
jgi:predicted  nucleic acid-binding Zn-ribbon protein